MINLVVPEDIQPLAQYGLEETSFLVSAAEKTLEYAGASKDVELSIVLGDNRLLHNLNLGFLGLDRPTDVLAFPATETDLDSGELYLGDVIISYQQAQAQATARGHTLQEELLLLVVHGVLHLLGYDHGKADEKQRMWSAQAEILRNLGVDFPSRLWEPEPE